MIGHHVDYLISRPGPGRWRQSRPADPEVEQDLLPREAEACQVRAQRQGGAVELLRDDRQYFDVDEVNSSRQLQAPACANPRKAVGLWQAVMLSLQLNRTQKIASAFIRFLRASVFSVPAGPRAAPGGG
jgi:hypothetical protein